MTAPIDYLSKIDSHTRALVEMSLEEDRVREDVTTLWSIPWEAPGKARLVAKQDGVFCAGELFASVFQAIDPKTSVNLKVAEGASIKKGEVCAEIDGRAGVLLAAERTALNLLGRFSGVATLTRTFVQAVEGTRAKIVDTRKTTPLWRKWEKYAVTQGGGFNHRMNLSDEVLLKDNHIGLSKSITEAYLVVKDKNFNKIPIEVEVDTLDQLRELLDVGVKRVLLDNMSLEDLKEAVNLCAGSVVLEASGGVNLETVRGIAETGVDRISVGALTHSVTCFDFSLEIVVENDDDLDKPNHRVVQ